ncbi:radical SAM/SPASM domain-containing protein [Oceanirhabdus sp. W0125-5]|uniref:radical SAM/SPASM domain-containing protein n=1 Tax=Oceanirhabdus sp. W0125-5 TaxID=2999116 RepID=UPI0022F2E331|nr:radical SAM protein [Oceanirhabdus sp. W0125-5]WBW95254.1 radical SAM protein [Oceanirhabdus sp. W0125-5]
MSRRYEIQIEIENQCLLNCKHCSSLTMRHAAKKEFIETEVFEFLSLFKGSTFLYFTGGEPLLDLGIIEKIRKINFKYPNINIGLYTCGIIKTKNVVSPISISRAKDMKRAGIKECYISLYHEDEKIHDYITNLKGSAIATKESICNLLSSGIDVKIHLVVNKYNVFNLRTTLNEISKLGVKEIRLLRMVRCGSAEEYWDDIGVAYKVQNKSIIDIMSEKDKFKTRITVSGFPEIFPCRPFVDSIKCQSGINVLYITHEGDVYPCACTKNGTNFLIGKISELKKIKNYISKTYDIDYYEECLNPIQE